VTDCCENGSEPLGSIKVGNFLIAELLSTFQGILCSLEFVDSSYVNIIHTSVSQGGIFSPRLFLPKCCVFFFKQL
jgi:hypothetical protein